MNVGEKLRYRTLGAVVAAACLGIGPPAAQAQGADRVEEVLITGSALRRQADFPQPVQIIDNAEIQLQQSNSMAELFKAMPQSDDSGVVAGLEYKKTQLLLAEDVWDRERLSNTLRINRQKNLCELARI